MFRWRFSTEMPPAQIGPGEHILHSKLDHGRAGLEKFAGQLEVVHARITVPPVGAVSFANELSVVEAKSRCLG